MLRDLIHVVIGAGVLIGAAQAADNPSLPKPKDGQPPASLSAAPDASVEKRSGPPETDAATEAPAAKPVVPPAPASKDHLPLGPAPRTSTPNSQTTTPAAARPSWILRTLGALGLVIAIALALRALLQRFGGPAMATPGGAKLVEVLSRTPIGHKTSVLILRVHQRLIVVAQNPSGCSTLGTFDDPVEVAAVLAEVEAARPKSISSGFRQMLHGYDAQHDDPTPDAEGLGDDEHRVDRTRDALSGLRSRIRSVSDSAEQSS